MTKLQAVNDFIIVKAPPEDMVVAGLTVKNTEKHVVEVYSVGEFVTPKINPGDKIVVSYVNGMALTHEFGKYFIIPSQDIVATVVE